MSETPHHEKAGLRESGVKKGQASLLPDDVMGVGGPSGEKPLGAAVAVPAPAWVAPMVTLVTGCEVRSDSDEWRMECLARWLLAMPTKRQRRDWLDLFEKKHTLRARLDLEGVALTIYRATQRKAA